MKNRINNILRFSLIAFALIHFSMRIAGGENAQSVLNQLYDCLNSRAVEISFSVNSHGNSQHGILLLDKERFTITTDDMSTWYDGKTQWTLSRSINEVNITQPTAEDLAEINPLIVLGKMGKQFNCELATSPAGTYTLILSAKDKNNPISSATIKVNAKDWTPTNLSILTYTGERYNITVDKIRTPEQPRNETFRFNQSDYPGVQIIDLR